MLLTVTKPGDGSCFPFKHFIIYLKLLKTLRSRTLFIVADYIILSSETLFLAARTF